MMQKKRCLLGLFIALGGILCGKNIPAQEINTILPSNGIVSPHIPDTFYDPSIDYGLFAGRVTDRTKDHMTIKVKFESSNVRLLRAGDLVKFEEKGKQEFRCDGYIIGVENNYLTISVPKVKLCRQERGNTIRIGTILHFESKIMRERVLHASSYRQILIKEKEDLLKQLKGINHYLWSFDQQRILVMGKYDKKIVEIEKEREKALDKILVEKKEKVVLQSDLKKELNLIDEKLDFYRIDRSEYLVDRFQADREYHLPVMDKPQEPVEVSAEVIKKHRWQ